MQSPSDFYKVQAAVAQHAQASANVTAPLAPVINSWVSKAQASTSNVTDLQFLAHLRSTLSNMAPIPSTRPALPQ